MALMKGFKQQLIDMRVNTSLEGNDLNTGRILYKHLFSLQQLGLTDPTCKLQHIACYQYPEGMAIKVLWSSNIHKAISVTRCKIPEST